MIQLTATPASALMDEPVHIRVTGLPPLQIVTLMASLKDEMGNVYRSKAFFKANEAGELDLEQDPACGGDYVGVHPMGLFWSMKSERPFCRLIKRDVMNSPFWVTLDLYDSVCLQDSVTLQPRARQTLQRWFSVPEVQRVQIREGEGPFPGIIDLFGGIGGLVEFRASLLAARGFAMMALAYFAYEDLPSQLQEVDLDYFEEAANLLLANPKIQKQGIGVLSISKGAEVGLAMACYLKQVAATVWINGTNAIFESPLKYRDMVMTPIPSFPERVQMDVSGAVRLRHYKGDPRDKLNQQSVLPVEKARGPILFIVSGDDECFNSREYAEQALDQLRSHGRRSGRMLVYQRAGHLLETPHAPSCYASWNQSLSAPVLWGGDRIAHGAAQERSWAEIQKFFRQHLLPTRGKI
ncbi:hypothetical protein HPG69_013583 [Diceros bicornis minor]|uniref:Uncharacterized protein n=1 Tax=Diceros bicornis minor TaxID=77932 RepID=A0A7J7EQM3_DICBM|nr:hypothetical protein HPG69_013583 [Diceros bicornis minor]